MTVLPDVPGAPCWIDLLSADVDRAREFYCELFGWSAGEPSAEFGGYSMFTRDGAPVAGCMPVPEGTDESDVWGVYLAVGDLRATVDAATGAGARVRQPALEIADLGASAIVTDPGGARVGFWQARTFAGFGATGPGTPPGAPAYFELHTRDYEACVAFYRDVVGWDARARAEVPGLNYTTLGGGDASAGIMDAAATLPDGAGAAWSVYFATADVDPTLARAERLGGGAPMPAMDTPFGRMAMLTDPIGAQFNLLGPAAAG